jgi:hypothetical protein
VIDPDWLGLRPAGTAATAISGAQIKLVAEVDNEQGLVAGRVDSYGPSFEQQ